MLARSPAKDGGKIPREVRRSDRIPLLESKSDVNVRGLPGRSEIQMSVTSPSAAPRPRTLSKKACMSPAKRISKAIQSPARRETQSHLTLDMSLRPRGLDTSSSSPKKSLGSPVRQHSATFAQDHKNTSSHTTLQSIPQIGVHDLRQSKTFLGSPERRPKLIEHQRNSTTVKSSPLKKPARRGLGRSTDATQQESRPTTGFSVLIGMNTARHCEKEEPIASLLDNRELEDINFNSSSSLAYDELSLLTPTKSMKHSKTILTIESLKVEQSQDKRHDPTASSTIYEDVKDEDEDELATTFTPIRVPQVAKTVASPPSFDLLDADSDLWVPSVPVSLTTSFSELRLTPDTGSQKRQHIHFDESGEPKELCQSLTADPLAMVRNEATCGSKTEAAPELVAFVDCKAGQDTGNSSEHFSEILAALGARTLRRWNWNPETQGTPGKRPRVGLTHVIFFNGTSRTLRKVKEARQLGVDVQCVGLSWVMQCKKSQRLSIGTAGHEVDVDAELIKLQGARRRSMEPSTLPASPTTTRTEIRIDYSAPVKFDSNPDAGPPCSPPQKKYMEIEISTKSDKLQNVPTFLTEFEIKQLALARRNSAKFRPPVSSPLSKKTWRA